MFTETRTIKLKASEKAQDFRDNYDSLGRDLVFLDVLKKLCGVNLIDFVSADKLLVTVGGSSRLANNHAFAAVEAAVRHRQPGWACGMLLCTKKEIERLTNGSRRFKAPEGVIIATGVPAEPYQRQPIFITSADESLLHATAEQFHKAQQQQAQQQQQQQQQTTQQLSSDSMPNHNHKAPGLRWFGDYEVRSIEDQLKPLLDHLESFYNLRPVSLEAGGTCFFRQWGLALYGSPQEGARVRHDVIMTIWTNPDLKLVADTMGVALCITAEDYLRTVETDLHFPGGDLEIAAAARRENSRVTLFVADVPEIRTVSSNGPTPPSHEVSFLTYQNRYWLLEPAQPAMPMEVELDEGGPC